MSDENSEKTPKCLMNPTHKVYFDEKENDWYCKGHYQSYLDNGFSERLAKGYSNLDGLNRGFLLNNVEYTESSEPLDKRKKIDNESLREIFVKRLQGKTLKVSVLKQIFEGQLKINDTDTSTTVVSSAIMRRLGRLTGYKWHQERLKGIKDNELLVKFTKGPEKYKSPKQLKQERLQQYIAEDKVNEKLNVLQSEKDDVESGYIVDEDGGTYKLDEEEKSYNLEYYKEEIKRLEKLLGAKGGDDDSSKESD